jgi:hypothetical protein
MSIALIKIIKTIPFNYYRMLAGSPSGITKKDA